MNLRSINPATGEVVWQGHAATAAQVHEAITHARGAFRDWSRRPLSDREALVRAFAQQLELKKDQLAEAISLEVGKPAWEALTEVQTMIGKVELSIRAHAQRCAEFTGGPAITRFRPHGVVAVFGPFNFPGHLPNGHIVPALLAGNTVVFKPSEHAPLVAELMADAWHDAGVPKGVFNLVQGGRETGAALASHAGIDGLFFTGSSRAGQWLAELFAKTPEKILALEMGGNNPLIVLDVQDTRSAALLIMQSAYLSAGQRCTCARRLIVREDDQLLPALASMVADIRVGAFTDRPEPFMGPVISKAAAEHVIATQATWLQQGAETLVTARHLQKHTGLVSPGLIDVTSLTSRADEEVFGPLLQVIRVPDFDAALIEANATRYGLAAGLLSDDAALYARFREEVRAGIINWNQQLTGASGAAPFGGVGHSGNHRPSAFFAADYCSYPVASIELGELKPPANLPPGLTP